jgi:hypothetical protein
VTGHAGRPFLHLFDFTVGARRDLYALSDQVAWVGPCLGRCGSAGLRWATRARFRWLVWW